MKLQTKRLELRYAKPRDAHHLQKLFSNRDVLRYLPPTPPMTMERAIKAVERRKKMEAELGYAPFLVFTADDGEFIGNCGIYPVKDTREVEIAYHFLPSAWGRGYATEAAVAVLGFAFSKAKLDEIVGFVFPDNAASWRVLEKAGMRYTGTTTYEGIKGLRKYVASRASWSPPTHGGSPSKVKAGEIEEFAGAYPNEIIGVMQILRQVVRSSAPGLKEILYHGALGYTPTGAPHDRVVYILPARKHVTLGFFFGTHLEDPANLLVGEGARMRHVKVKTEAEAKNPAVRRLVQQARADAPGSLAAVHKRFNT